MGQNRGLLFAIIFCLVLISSGLIYDRCTREENNQNSVINHPKDSIVPEQNHQIHDSVEVRYVTKYKTKTKTEYVPILDTFLTRELDKYKAEYLKLLDSLNVKVVTNYDTTFPEPVYMKRLGIENECLTGLYTLNILEAQKNFIINNPVREYCPPRSFYDNPYVATGTGFLGGFLVGYFAGSVTGGGK